MNKSVIFGAVMLLIFPSMQVRADAMNRGIGFDGASQAQSGAKTKSMRSAAPQSALNVALPGALPENPQCGSVGGPCVEKVQPANNSDKEKLSGKE